MDHLVGNIDQWIPPTFHAKIHGFRLRFSLLNHPAIDEFHRKGFPSQRNYHQVQLDHKHKADSEGTATAMKSWLDETWGWIKAYEILMKY